VSDPAGTPRLAGLRDTLRETLALLRSPRGLAWAGALLLASVGLMFAPQFDLLNYFFSLAAALLVGIAASHLGLGAGRRLRLRPGAAPDGAGEPPPPPPVGRTLGAAVLAALALALVPLAVVTLNAVRVRNCDYPGGLLFYALGPLAGAVYAALAGALAGAVARRRLWQRLAYAALISLAVALPAWRFFTQPPVHFYHPVLGYFSGAVYDELIEITAPFAVSRLVDLLAACAVVTGLAVCRERRRGDWRWPWRSGAPRARVVWFGVALAAALGGAALPGTLGYRHDRTAIRAALGGHLRTPHFDVWYAGGTPYERVVPRVAGDAERSWADLTAVFGDAPAGRIDIYLYPDAATKRRLMGADRVYIAKPWLGEVHLNRMDVGADVLRHELVHAVAAVCSDDPLGVPARWGVLPHMAVIEGLAEAIEWSGGRLTLHEASAAMRRLGIAPDLRRIMGPDGFWTTAAGKAYVTAGSFVRFLLERRGNRPICALYRDADFEAAYGQPLEELAAEWEAFLDDPRAVPLSDEDLQLAKDALDRPPVFRKVCALEVARYERAAGRAAGRRQFDEAARLLGVVAGFDPRSAEKRLAYGGALLRADVLDAARAMFENVAADERAGRVPRLRAWVGLADVLWAEGEGEAAAMRYEALLDEPLPTDERRVLEVKAALAGGPPERSALFAAYFLEPLPPTVADARLAAWVLRHPVDALPAYLLGRRRLAQGRAGEGAESLAVALWHGPLPDAVGREALRLLGVARFFAGDLAQAESPLRKALELARFEAERVDLRTWLARVEWWRRHPPDGLPR
jgi:tetratricopeptide (TPR) repeat protein